MTFFLSTLVRVLRPARVAPAFAFVLSAASLTACGARVDSGSPSDPSPSDSDGDGGVTTPAAGADTDADAGACTTALDPDASTFGAVCRATYGDALSAASACGLAAVSTGGCDGLESILYDWGTHSQTCVYSGTGAAPLVGYALESDENEYCGGTAYVILGGTVPDACQPGRARLSPVACVPPDASTDASADAGSD